MEIEILHSFNNLASLFFCMLNGENRLKTDDAKMIQIAYEVWEKPFYSIWNLTADYCNPAKASPATQILCFIFSHSCENIWELKLGKIGIFTLLF